MRRASPFWRAADWRSLLSRPLVESDLPEQGVRAGEQGPLAGPRAIDRRPSEQAPAGPALAHLDVDQHGFAWLPEDDFVKHFAADVDPIKAKVMFAVQQPLHWSALGEVMGVPAWKSLPTWFLIADGDQAIPPDAQRQFAPRMGATSVEIATNHVAMVSHPDDVLQLIKKAAGAASG
jgi:hypothetical protein